MIVLGIILLVAGFLLKISLLWTIGLILLVVGLVLMDHGTDGTRCRRTQPLLLAGHAKPAHARGSCPANAMGPTPTSNITLNSGLALVTGLCMRATPPSNGVYVLVVSA